jgi:hypothetical protein
MPPLGHFSLIRFSRLDPRAGEHFALATGAVR